MTEAWDLAIVGGGPAGLTTAIEARLAGLDAVVIDRCRPPIDVACGEGLMPGGVERLLRLGVALSEDDGWFFHGVCYIDGEVKAQARFASGAGLGVRRTALHRALLRRAEELGVELRWGVKARAIQADGIETDGGVFKARWLVAADGRLSALRTWSGITTTVPERKRFGIRRHYEMAPWSDLVEVHWADEGEVYVTPVGPETVGVAVLSSDRPLDFDRHLRAFPALSRRLEGARVASRDRGAGPFGQRPATVVRDRLVLVGDASGCLDPITGEGMAVACGQAQALVRAVRRGEIEHYSADHARLMRTPRMLTALLLTAERRPPVRRATIRILAACPRLFSWVVGQVARAGRNRQLVKRSG